MSKQKEQTKEEYEEEFIVYKVYKRKGYNSYRDYVLVNDTIGEIVFYIRDGMTIDNVLWMLEEEFKKEYEEVK